MLPLNKDKSIKIASHGGNVHLDDHLAVSLLYYKLWQGGYDNIEVIRHDLKEDQLMDVAYVIDMGLKYDGAKYFDHHQDQNIECSLFLIAKHFGEDYYRVMKNNSEFTFLDTKDRFGVKEAMKLPPAFYQDYSKMLEYVLMNTTAPESKESPYFYIGKSLHHYLLRKIGMSEKAKFITSNVKCINRNGLNVCYVDEELDMPSMVFGLYDCDLLIYRNSRSKDCVQITKNTNRESSNAVDLRKIGDKFDIDFIHATGFTVAIKHSDSIDQDLCSNILDILVH